MIRYISKGAVIFATLAVVSARNSVPPKAKSSVSQHHRRDQCMDVSGWTDSLGFTCDDYAFGFYCQLFGNSFENLGNTANQACCVCGGGLTGDVGNTTVVYGLQPSCNSIDSDRYNMCLDLQSLSGSYESWMEAYSTAKQRWESIIVGNLPSFSSSVLGSSDDLTNACTSYPTTVDDVYICGQEVDIDGPDGVLGSSLPVYTRGSGEINPRTGEEYSVTLTGRMFFDAADIAILTANGQFDEVVFHEMGHVLGAGTLWGENGLYSNGSGLYASGTHADDEWKAIGCSGPLPVELDGGQGTADGHWDEDCLQDELMTGYISGAAQPVSRITIGSFEDMGYNVDYNQADPFDTSDLGFCGSSCPAARRGLRTQRQMKKKTLDKKDQDAVMRYAKSKLMKLHKDMDHVDVRLADGVKLGDSMEVLYRDSGGILYSVHVSLDAVKDLDV